jgi:hypothetical protein
MLPAPRASLSANSLDFETLPLVKPTGFRVERSQDLTATLAGAGGQPDKQHQ